MYQIFSYVPDIFSLSTQESEFLHISIISLKSSNITETDAVIRATPIAYRAIQ